MDNIYNEYMNRYSYIQMKDILAVSEAVIYRGGEGNGQSA